MKIFYKTILIVILTLFYSCYKYSSLQITYDYDGDGDHDVLFKVDAEHVDLALGDFQFTHTLQNHNILDDTKNNLNSNIGSETKSNN